MARFNRSKVSVFNQTTNKTSTNFEEIHCRICFELEKNRKKIIFPCNCTGSMKYVHEECLKLWILSSNQDLKSAQCDICKQNFAIELVMKQKCSCENFNNECLNIIIFPIFILIISAVLSIVLALFVNEVQNNKLDSKEIVYYSLVIIACLIILGLLVCIYYKTMKRSFCIMKMDDWHIKSAFKLRLGDFTELNKTVDVVQTEVSIDPVSIIDPIKPMCKGNDVIKPEIKIFEQKDINKEKSGFFSHQVSYNSQNKSSNVSFYSLPENNFEEFDNT